jgi:hypothetical protein
LRDNNIRFAIAGAALVVVLGAITYSKKQGSGMEDEAPVTANA